VRLPVGILMVILVARPLEAAAIPTFILAGQSNAVGGAWPPYPPGELADPQDSLYNYLINPGSSAPFEAPSWEHVRSLWPNVANVSFGVEITFAHAMQARLGEPIAIIKVAQNGVGLHVNWRPAANDLYPPAIAKIQDALAELESLGHTPQLSGVLWVQGETDSGWDFWAGQYKQNLEALAAQFRSDLNAPELPWALNLLHIGVSQYHAGVGAAGAVELLRQQQRDFVASDPYAMSFDPSDLEQSWDYLHYTNESFLELGRRFADLFIPSADFNDDGAVDSLDLELWKQGQGDSNADGLADGTDFLLWQRQLTAPVTGAGEIPEPSTLCLVTSVVVVMTTWSRRMAALTPSFAA
jgi:hypothetical protein